MYKIFWQSIEHTSCNILKWNSAVISLDLTDTMYCLAFCRTWFVLELFKLHFFLLLSSYQNNTLKLSAICERTDLRPLSLVIRGFCLEGQRRSKWWVKGLSSLSPSISQFLATLLWQWYIFVRNYRLCCWSIVYSLCCGFSWEVNPDENSIFFFYTYRNP